LNRAGIDIRSNPYGVLASWLKMPDIIPTWQSERRHGLAF
jgi:hypothetical protein